MALIPELKIRLAAVWKRTRSKTVKLIHKDVSELGFVYLDPGLCLMQRFIVLRIPYHFAWAMLVIPVGQEIKQQSTIPHKPLNPSRTEIRVLRIVLAEPGADR